MIKIKSSFDRTSFINVTSDDSTPLYKYYYSMFNNFMDKYKGHLIYQDVTIVDGDFEFQFLPRVINPKSGNPYTISFKTLLTGTRDEVMAVDGIKFYMDICRLRSCVKSKIKEADFLKQLYKVFPDEIVGPTFDNPNKYIFYNSKEVNVQEGNHPSVDDFGIIADFIQAKIKSYDIGYNSYYSSIVRIDYLNKLKVKKRHYSIPTNLTFEEVKKYLIMMYTDVTELLNTGVTYKTKSKNNSSGSNNTPRVPFINYDDVGADIRHDLLDSLGIKTCPYCNRQFITSYIKENSTKTTADLDHFYLKSRFPLFAISTFNFIPSCHVCNSLMKGERYAEILYPYEDAAEEDIQFSIILKNNLKNNNIVDIWLGKGKESFSDIQRISELSLINLIKGKNENNKSDRDKYREKRIDNEIELFRLNESYKSHLDQAINVLLILRIYLEGYFYTNNINSICRNIGITSVKSGSIISKEEIRSFLLGLVTDGQDEMDKPLAKLTSDIYNSEVDNTIDSQKVTNSLDKFIFGTKIHDAIDLLRFIKLSDEEITDILSKKFGVTIDELNRFMMTEL